MTRVRNLPGVARGPVRMMRRPKIRPTWSGRPMSRLSRMACSKKIRPATGVSRTWVRENSACTTEISYRYPAAWSAGEYGHGRMSSHRAASAWIPCSSKESQICCTAATSSQAANPLSSAVKPIPARAAICLAYSLPLQLGVVGEIAAVLEEERSRAPVVAVEIPLGDHPAGPRDPRVGPALGVAALSADFRAASSALGSGEFEGELASAPPGDAVVGGKAGV